METETRRTGCGHSGGRRGWDLRAELWDIYITICKTDSKWAFAVWHWELNPVLCDNLEGWDWRKKWQPTPVFLPGESQGRGGGVPRGLPSMGSHGVGHDWSDLAAAAVTKSCPPVLQSYGRWPTRLLCQWDFLGKNTGVHCHFLLWGIFPTDPGIKPESPELAGRCFTTEPPGKPWALPNLC